MKKKKNEKIEPLRKKSNELYDSLDLYGVTQTSFRLWVEEVHGKVKGLSKANINGYLGEGDYSRHYPTMKRISDLMEEYAAEVIRKKNAYPHLASPQFHSNQKPIQGNTLHGGNNRNREASRAFLNSDKLSTNNSLDVLGIQNSDIRTVLETLRRSTNTPKITGRILLLSPEGISARQRAKLEGRDPTDYINGTLRDSFSSWKALSTALKESSISFTLHPYDLLPSCKIIRLNDEMLVSPYLEGRAYSSFYNIYSRKDHPGIFERCMEYFEFMMKQSRTNEEIAAAYTINTKEYAVRTAGTVYEFIANACREYTGAGESITMDCVGIKCASVRKAVQSLIEAEEFPKIDLRMIVLDPDAYGVKTRSAIEKHLSLQQSTNRNITELHKLGNEIKNYNNSSLTVRLLFSDPNIYMIRINSRIYSSVYYAKRGNQSPYAVFYKNSPGLSAKMYKQNDLLFQRYFTSNKLSRPMLLD